MVKTVVVIVGQVDGRCVTVITMTSGVDSERLGAPGLAPEDEYVAADVVAEGGRDCVDCNPCWLVTDV